jgi:hypothetical protein
MQTTTVGFLLLFKTFAQMDLSTFLQRQNILQVTVITFHPNSFKVM